jgi:CRISPR-associated endonuclease Cas2
MRCLLIYDIPDDRVRQKIADACLDYGLAAHSIQRICRAT